MRKLLLMLFMVISVGAPILTCTSAGALDLIPNEYCQDAAKNAGGANSKNSPTVCKDDNPGTDSDNALFGPNGLFVLITNILSIIIAFASIVVIIIAGLQYMLSTGDPTKVNNAKNTILYAVVGLIIAGAAQTIVRFIISKV